MSSTRLLASLTIAKAIGRNSSKSSFCFLGFDSEEILDLRL